MKADAPILAPLSFHDRGTLESFRCFVQEEGSVGKKIKFRLEAREKILRGATLKKNLSFCSAGSTERCTLAVALKR